MLNEEFNQAYQVSRSARVLQDFFHFFVIFVALPGEFMFFVNALRGRNSFLFFFLTLLLILAGFVTGQIPLTIALEQTSGTNDQKLSLDFKNLEIDPNWGLLLMLLSFVGAFVAVIIAMAIIHKRPWISLINPNHTIDWQRIGGSFVLWFGFTLLAELFMYTLDPDAYTFQFNWRTFVPLVVISFLFIPIQSTFEEIFVRGYLLQQIGMAFNSRWLSVLLTSLIFGLMHGLNPEVEKFGFSTMMIYYVSFGLLLSVCTVLDDRLEIAIGMHAANNIYGATIVSFAGSALQTPAIFYLAELNLTFMFIFYFIFAGCFFYFFATKYQWLAQHRFRNKIF